MSFQPGQSGNPAGRKPGAVNETTRQIKEVFARILEGREEELSQALDKLREKDPKSFLEMYVKISQRFVPEVSRAEVTGQDGEPFQPIQIVLPKKDE